MNITPALTPARFANLNGGELFLYRHYIGAAAGFIAIDPTANGQKFEIPLGVDPAVVPEGPRLYEAQNLTVRSFGNEFELRLPTTPSRWLFDDPPADCQCIAITDAGAFIRVNFSRWQGQFRTCYVDMATGHIVVSEAGDAYATPPGIKAFATEWTLAVPGKDGAVILAYKWPRQEAFDLGE